MELQLAAKEVAGNEKRTILRSTQELDEQEDEDASGGGEPRSAPISDATLLKPVSSESGLGESPVDICELD